MFFPEMEFIGLDTIRILYRYCSNEITYRRKVWNHFGLIYAVPFVVTDNRGLSNPWSLELPSQLWATLCLGERKGRIG